MVVVAIIGILATVAVPNFMRFQSKAKQSNAKVELAAIYTAETAFFAEHTSYHGYLSYIGFLPDGCTGAGACTGNTRIYASGFSAAGVTAAFGGVATGTNTAFAYPGNAAGSSPAITAITAGTAAAGTFTATATGTVRTGMTDTWTMTEAKTLTNTSVGF
jgi:type IV pilus assembly protein PilA